MDLQELYFKTNTTELKEAADRIAQLTVAITELESKQKSAAQVQKESSKAERQALKDAAELIKLKEKLAKAESDATAKADGTTEANKKQSDASSKLASMLERLNSLYVGMASGSTRAEASILHMAKTLGASDEQFQKVKQSLEQIGSLSKNPFDSSLGSLRSINSEMQALKDRAKLASDGISLTTKQLQEYSRLGSEVRGQMQSKGIDTTKGEGRDQYSAELAKQQSQYAAVAKEVNNLKSLEKTRIDFLAAQKKVSDDLFTNTLLRQKQEQESYKSQMQEMKNFYSMQEKEAINSSNSIAAIRQRDSDALLKNNLLRQKQEQETYKSQMQSMKAFYAEQEKEAQSAEKYLNQINQRIARDAAASRYIDKGASVSTANYAAGMETRGVDKSIINSFVESANAKEKDAKASRELVAATKYIAETEDRLAAAVNNANQNLNRQSTDELTKYQKALLTTGASAEDTTRKMAALKTQLDTVAGKEREQQLSHLSRSISTQMGDVGISLASGMNPLTVMLQQGDQIRFALQQAGAEGKELQTAMKGAASQIASSIVLTAKAMGGFFLGSIGSMGKAMSGFILNIGGMNTLLRNFELTLAISADTGGKFEKAMYSAFTTTRVAATALAGVLSATLIGAFLALGVAFYQVNKEQNALAVSMAQTGGMFGFTRQSAMEYAEALTQVSGHTTSAIEVITLMAKSGAFTRNEIDMVAKSAIEMEKYAGIALEDTVKSFEKLKGKPVEAILELAASTGRLTPEVVKNILELERQGRTAELTATAMTLLANSNSESVAQMKQDFTEFASFMKGVYEFSVKVYEGLKDPIRQLWSQDLSVNILKRVDEAGKTIAMAKKGIAAGVMVDMNKKILDQSTAELNTAMTDLENFRKQKTVQPATTGNAQSGEILGLARQAQLESETAIEKKKRQIEESKQQYKDMETKYGKEKGNELALTTFRLANESKLAKFKKELSDLEEAKAKKDKGPKAPTSSFSGVASTVSLVSNVPNIQREYSSELSKQEKFAKQQRDILKMQYDAGLVSRGEYIAKDVKLIQEGQNKELKVINEFGKKVEEEQARLTEKVNARRKDALAATKDPGSMIKINRAADDELKKLLEAGNTFKELQADRTETTNFEAERRYYESLKEQNVAILESKKHLEDLNKTMQDSSEAQRLEIDFQMKSISLAGGELESYKARNDVLKDYVKTKESLRRSVSRETKVYEDMLLGSDGSKESQDRVMQQWQIVQTLKDQIIKASIDSEESARIASITAVGKYYMQKATEVRDGTANAITEGIMNGGKAGSDAIKNVLNNILKDLLNNVFKQILGTVGDMILKSIMQSQMASSTASSGGGFLEGLFKMGANALAGGMTGGVPSPVGASPYAFSSGTSISGFRAVGGFVNQGSEYMVGENGPEKFIPKQTGSIVPNHKLASQSASSDPMKVTIINNTSSPIGKVTERQISPTERALVIEEAVAAVASAMYDPNHKVSKSFGQNYSAQRKR